MDIPVTLQTGITYKEMAKWAQVRVNKENSALLELGYEIHVTIHFRAYNKTN